MDTWRTWELVLPALEDRHDVLALTLPGHAGGAPIEGPVDDASLADAVERVMDAVGFEIAHVVGSSLGGFLALQLAARGRAQTVVALAPAGGWSKRDRSYEELLRCQRMIQASTAAAAPHAGAILATVQGRRQATRLITTNFEHIPAELLAHQLLGVAACEAARELIDHPMREGWNIDAEKITCPVRIVWGTEDKLLPWPQATVRFRHDWLPHTDWVVLDGIGHYPQLDVPRETAQLILGFTAP